MDDRNSNHCTVHEQNLTILHGSTRNCTERSCVGIRILIKFTVRSTHLSRIFCSLEEEFLLLVLFKLHERNSKVYQLSLSFKEKPVSVWSLMTN